MAPRKNNNYTKQDHKPSSVEYAGLVYTKEVPSKQYNSYSSSSSSRGRDMKNSTQLHTATKSIYKNDNGKASTTFKNTLSCDEFVDRRSGRLGFKKEVTYSRKDKYDNKNDGKY
ncbi:hypothetical protein CsatB_015831 [Cannabis sativa]